ncbi:glycosyltransferase family 2 protein [Pedobacter xixiisoli]|nr:glycosyltransferase family 2 protein [Pedobacter xixiisoli]
MSLLTIISINYNSKNGLQKTIESVIKQSWKDFEYIVIDGGSTDGSLEVVKNYQDYINYDISEPDNGVFNAMNKGAKAANGDYLLFLNSGDILHNDESLSKLVAQMMQKSDSDIYYTNLLLADLENDTERIHQCPNHLTLTYFTGSFIGHPASLIKRTVFNTMGGYSEDYHIISDWLFFVKAFLAGYTFQYIDMILSTFFLDGVSSNGNAQHAEEVKRVYQNELSFIASDMKSLRKVNTRPYRFMEKLLSKIRTH